MDNVVEVTRSRRDKEGFTDKMKAQWTDWQWQLKNSISRVDTVEEVLGIEFSLPERVEIFKTLEYFPMSITPYYLSLVDPADIANDPVFKQAFPDPREMDFSDVDMDDPLHEDADSPVPGVTHRYPDRVLLHVSNVCSMYCRHCTRKRKVGDTDFIPGKEVIEKGIEYIKNTPQVRDVLLSGGDPFMLKDEYIDWILTELRRIEHVEVIRIGTRMPVVLPYRITDSLVDVLKKHGPVWINTHFNHPREITPSAKQALEKLAMAGIPLGNQSVLLAGVNDCPRIMKKLVHKLVMNRVRPYYVYQCDLSMGLSHFRTSVGKGLEIIENLRGHTSGFAVPTYVIDAPGGGGKIPINPNYMLSWSDNKVILRNFEGVITTYEMPSEYRPPECNLKCSECTLHLKTENNEDLSVGVARLLCNTQDDYSLEPAKLERGERFEKSSE